MTSQRQPVTVQALRRYGALAGSIVHLMQRTIWPKFDLLARLWLALLFLKSGVVKLTNWDTALELARSEYPVSWLEPVTAAWLGTAIELVGGGLLAVGLLTRYAALALLALTWVIQTEYVALDSQLFWLVAFGWYALAGAGRHSVDQLVRRGLAASALPLVPRIVRVTAWVREKIGPLYLSAVRLWMSVSLLMVSGALVPFQEQIFPMKTLATLPVSVALIAGAMLLVGAATRYTAVALLALSAGMSVTQAQMTGEVYLLATLALFVIQGAGPLSLDALTRPLLRGWLPSLVSEPAFSQDGLPRIVIVGAGFGGLACAQALRTAPASITLIDRANHHLFQPLLYQVATAALSPSDVAAPVRPLFRDAPNVQVLLGTVTAVDTVRRYVHVHGRDVPYDYLVIATGAAHSYFGKDHWAPVAPGLKRIEDATEIRGRILRAFEDAEATEDPAERAALLTFLVVGAGPTGVELAGAIAELARLGMEKDFRNFDPASAQVILVQSGPRVLPAFPARLSAIAQRDLEALGVEVRLNSRVEQIDADGVLVSGQRIVARTVLWAAGVSASAAAQWLGASADSAGRLLVGSDLSVPGCPGIYALGDTVASTAWAGKPVPGLAPAAKQGGIYVARVLRARLDGRRAPAAFRYRHIGSLATIGRKAAVADFRYVTLWGAPAWWLWGLVHIGLLVGVRNRLTTLVNWFWAYLTYGGGIRLITGQEDRPRPVVSER